MENSNQTFVKEVASNLVNLGSAGNLDFTPQPRTLKSYGVSIKYFQEDDVEPNKRLDYQIDLRVDQFRDEPKTWQMMFNKRDLFINQHEPDLISEQLANLAMEALYPIKVDVNAKNEVFRGIVNHNDIKNRWETAKEKIIDKYEGDVTDLFIKKMEEKILSAYQIQQSLHFDMFWSMFFHPLYQNYNNNLTQTINFIFPIFPYQTYSFEGTQTIEKTLTSYGTIHINFNAKVDFNAEEAKAFNLNGPHTMNLTAFWDLDEKGGLLKHNNVDWTLSKIAKDEVIGIKRIKFSAYETSNETAKESLSSKHNNQNAAIKTKKGFWERILG